MTTPKTARDYAEQYAKEPTTADFPAIRAIEDAVASLQGLFKAQHRNDGRWIIELGRDEDFMVPYCELSLKWTPAKGLQVHIDHPMYTGVVTASELPAILGRLLAPYMPKPVINSPKEES